MTHSFGPITPVEIILTAGGAVRGSVTIDGKPVPGKQVSVWYEPRHFHPDNYVVTRDDGTYELSKVMPGEVDVVLSFRLEDSAGYVKQIRSATVRDGETTPQDFDVSLGRGVVRGSLSLDRSLLEYASVTVQIPTTGATEERFARVRADGSFQLGRLPDGSMDLRAEAVLVSGDKLQRSLSVQLRDGEVLEQEIEFSR